MRRLRHDVPLPVSVSPDVALTWAREMAEAVHRRVIACGGSQGEQVEEPVTRQRTAECFQKTSNI